MPPKFTLTLSKSRYIRGLQCHKSLWLRTHKPELSEESAEAQAAFRNGHEVGELARDLFPCGVLIPYDDLSYDAQIALTQKALKTAKVIYEAAFCHDGVFVKADIIRKTAKGWNLYEVKSSTKVKDINLDDVAVQYHVLSDCGVPLASFGPVWAGANLVVALFAVASHRLRAFLGNRGMILLVVLLVWGGYLGLGTTAGVWGFLFYYLLTAMRGMKGPYMLHLAQAEIPSATRAGMLSLQSLCFRLIFALTGPLVGRYADAHGVGHTFQLLLYAYLLILPPLVWLFLRQHEKNPEA